MSNFTFNLEKVAAVIASEKFPQYEAAEQRDAAIRFLTDSLWMDVQEVGSGPFAFLHIGEDYATRTAALTGSPLTAEQGAHLFLGKRLERLANSVRFHKKLAKHVAKECASVESAFDPSPNPRAVLSFQVPDVMGGAA